MNWYLKAIKQYADFSGRARRKEYWMFLLFNMFFTIAAVIMDNIFGIAKDGFGYGPVYALYVLGMFIPGFAVTVRRLHDTGKSGWIFLVVFIPLIGVFWLLFLLLTESQPGTNKWGENPKERTD